MAVWCWSSQSLRKRNGGKHQQAAKLSSCAEGTPEATETASDARFGWIFSALSVCPKWSESHEANYPLSHHHFHRPSDNMGLRDGLRNLLSLPRKDQRARNEGRGEAGPIPDPGQAGLVVPRPPESSPDLRIGPLTLPTSSPSTSRDQESNGMSTTLFRVIHLTTSPARRRPPR
jgi:hypothetical protein